MTRTLPLLTLLILAACASDQPFDNGGGSSGFGEQAPVEWQQGHAPHRYDIHGIDVARLQESVNWHAARDACVQFAFIKATKGGDMLESTGIVARYSLCGSPSLILSQGIHEGSQKAAILTISSVQGNQQDIDR